MDIDKVRELNDAELGAELVTQRRNLYDLRFQLATRQLTDHSQLTSSRRSIARILTVMTERGLDENTIVRQAPEARQPAGRARTATRKRAADETAKAPRARRATAAKAAPAGDSE